jgi:hypothetical protein
VLGQVRLERLARDVDLDRTVALDLRLAAEARVVPHVEGLIENIVLFVFHLGQELAALGHVNVAGRAGAHAAAGAALGGAHELRGLQDARARGHGDFFVLFNET